MKKAIFILLFLAIAASAQSSFYDVTGYVKYLFTTSKYPFFKDRLNDHLVHARINAHFYPTDQMMAAVEIRNRFFYGSSVEKIPNFIDLLKSHYEFSQMDAVLWDREKSIGYTQVDRLWLDYTTGNLQITLGRQRVAWGTALVWNVIDLYNPKSILDWDYEEKPGADAIRLQYYTGPVTKVEFTVKPGKKRENAIVSGLFSVNWSGYDLFGIAGIRQNRWIVGGAWAGNIKKGGFRGEFTVSEAPSKNSIAFNPFLSLFGASDFSSDKPVVSVVLSYDYTFPNSFYWLTEILYNSNGKTENTGLFQQAALQAGLLSPARWSFFQELAYDITPLTRATLFAIHNPNDKSSIIVPMLEHSLATNLDLSFVGFVTSGEHLTEFGDYGNSVFVRLKYSF